MMHTYEDHIQVKDQSYQITSLDKLQAAYPVLDIQRLPVTLRILLENVARHMGGPHVKNADIGAFSEWLSQGGRCEQEIAYHPARVLMQDFTGVPAVVDLAAMRDTVAERGGDPQTINPIIPVDLVIDHSVQVDSSGHPSSFSRNVALEMERNQERYELLKWAQQAFENFRVVPPGTGICHQVNLEYLAQGVWTHQKDGQSWAYPDTLVGTDSHTTMINGLGVLGWGVGGIEAEAAMLGQPISMRLPPVIGVELIGQLSEGITATDLVLQITHMLRKEGVVGCFVEFFGEGLDHLTLSERATIANMAPEYGATCGFFPIDDETLHYMALTGRSEQQLELIKHYCQHQHLWRQPAQEIVYTRRLSFDLGAVQATLAGPKRPQDQATLSGVAPTLALQQQSGQNTTETIVSTTMALPAFPVVIAAITSCTNTSNPSVLMAAGLLASKALEKGLQVPAWVKTSLAPGSQVVMRYLEEAGLVEPLAQLGFDLVGFGCTTCIGNSGPLDPAVTEALEQGHHHACAVLSGNRNFEGRIHPLTRANWLASPPLVVAYALAGHMQLDLGQDPLGHDQDDNPVYLRDLWPSSAEIQDCLQHVNQKLFKEQYATVFEGDDLWQSIATHPSRTYPWKETSTYVRKPTFFNQTTQGQSITQARLLAYLGDSVTTDHISPAGVIPSQGPAGQYLQARGIEPRQFNSFGSRRGNHEVMTRGTFANIRLRNRLAGNLEGGWTRHHSRQEVESIYDVAMAYQSEITPLIIVAGKEYGTGSSRDWAAKGTRLLGVQAVIAESYERIHRSNLVGMGVLPLELPEGILAESLQLDGQETFDITGIPEAMAKPKSAVQWLIKRPDGRVDTLTLTCRLDTLHDIHAYLAGGILPYVLKGLAHSSV